MAFDPLTAGLKLGEKLIDMVDPTERKKAVLEFEVEMKKAENAIQLSQNDVNKTQAEHDSLFVAGGRPSVFWVCSAGLFIAMPLFFLFQIFMWCYLVIWVGQHDTPAPIFDIKDLLVLLGGMLGLSGIRSNEKIKGVAREGLNLKPGGGFFSRFRKK